MELSRRKRTDEEKISLEFSVMSTKFPCDEWTRDGPATGSHTEGVHSELWRMQECTSPYVISDTACEFVVKIIPCQFQAPVIPNVPRGEKTSYAAMVAQTIYACPSLGGQTPKRRRQIASKKKMSDPNYSPAVIIPRRTN